MDVVARRHVIKSSSFPTGVVLQPGLARHGVLPQRGQQRHPEGQPACRNGPPQLRHLRVQPPPQPHQGAAVLRGHVSLTLQGKKG